MATITRSTFISDMKTFDNLAAGFNSALTPIGRATLIAQFCRACHYGGLKWHLTLGVVTPAFVTYVQKNNVTLYNRYYNIGNADLFLIDKDGKYVDVPHLFASMQAFIVDIINKEWFSWAGDLASSVNPIMSKFYGGGNFDKLVQESESYFFKSSGNFPENDLTADFDGEYIAYQIKNYGKTLSGAIEYYYNSLSSGRYKLVTNLHGPSLDGYVYGKMRNSDLVSAFDIKWNEEQFTAIVGTYISKIRRLM